MSFNNGLERKKFNLVQKKCRCEYLAAQMSEESIGEMYEFDLALFNSNRRYCEHTQPLISSGVDVGEEDNEKNLPFLKFEKSLSFRDDTSIYHSRYWWVQEIESPALSKWLNLISKEDLELLTMIVVDGYTQQEVAEIQGVNQSVVSRKLKRLKKFLMEVI